MAPEWLLAGKADGFLDDAEYRLEASDLEHLPGRRAGAGELELAAALAGVPVSGEQHVDAGRVAEVDPRHVHDQPGLAGAERRQQPSLGRRRGVEINLSRHREDGVLPLRSGRDL